MTMPTLTVLLVILTTVLTTTLASANEATAALPLQTSNSAASAPDYDTRKIVDISLAGLGIVLAGTGALWAVH